jgi:hypothetical protein
VTPATLGAPLRRPERVEEALAVGER